MKPVQIDPRGCGCTECIIGEYVPLDEATTGQVLALMNGELGNATSEEFTLSTTITGSPPFDGTEPVTITITARYSGITWTSVNGLEVKGMRL